MASGTYPKYADGTDSGWLVATPKSEATYNGTINYRKVGNLVTVKFQFNNVTANQSIANLPSGYRPTSDVFTPAIVGYPLYKVVGFVRFYSGGSIQVQITPDVTVGANGQYYGYVSFYTD